MYICSTCPESSWSALALQDVHIQYEHVKLPCGESENLGKNLTLTGGDSGGV